MRKIFLFLYFFVTIVSIAYSQNNLYRAVYNGDIEYIKKYFIDCPYSDEHYDFSNSDLRILRNTIYAMHGFKFKSKDLQEHFQKFEWYSGTKDNVEHEFSKNELLWIRIITATEKANPPKPKDLTGHWQGVAPPGSSQETLDFINIYIHEDGTMQLDEYKGYWSLEGTTFRTSQLRFISDEIKNFRINFALYNDELYMVLPFLFGMSFYGPNKYPPINYEGWTFQ